MSQPNGHLRCPKCEHWLNVVYQDTHDYECSSSACKRKWRKTWVHWPLLVEPFEKYTFGIVEVK